MVGAPHTIGAFTGAIAHMVRSFSGDVPAQMVEVEKVCPGMASDHLWPLLGAFKTYARAISDFTMPRYVQVHRNEYHSEEDWDALQEARKDVPAQIVEVEKVCRGMASDHLWPLLGAFKAYVAAISDFTMPRYVQVHRKEYHSEQDWDALQEARKECDEVQGQVQLQARADGEFDRHRDITEDEDLYVTGNLDNFR